MRIFIDLGVWNGVSIKLFFENKLKLPYPQITNRKEVYTAYGFDPLTTFLPEMKELEQKYPFTFINKAAWIYDGEVEFGEYFHTESSSIKKEKFNFASATIKKVPCIDFSRWFKNLCDSEKPEEVILKMNIEGAEVDILEKMIEDDTLKLVNYLFIETHMGKLDRNHDERMEKLKSFLPPWEEYVRPPL